MRTNIKSLWFFLSFFYEQQDCLIENFLCLRFEGHWGLGFLGYLINVFLGLLVYYFVEVFQIVAVFFGVWLLARIIPQWFRPKSFLRNLQSLIKILKQQFGLIPIAFFDIFPINLHNRRKPIYDKFLQKCTGSNRIPFILDTQCFQIY